MNNIEHNAILFYADYLSLKALSQPVTDNCKYFFIYGYPINAACLLNLEPVYDPDNKYILESYNTFNLIRDQYDDDAAMSFINDICFIRACGMVDAERMLKQIHMFSTKQERKQAFNEYKTWKNNLRYTHQVFDDNGNPQQQQCTKYFKHAETLRQKQEILNASTQI